MMEATSDADLFQPLNYSVRSITDQEFALFQALIYREAGVYLSAAKKALLVGRLSKRVRLLGLGSFGAYYRHVTVDDEELIQMFDCVLTNETRFFREARHFEFLEQTLYPSWARQRARVIRVWSAACSSGEEPYSLAMSLLDHFPPAAGWRFEILATDLSTKILAQAEAAVWPIEKAAEIPGHYLKRFMLKGSDAQVGWMKAGPALREAVRFRRLNLNDSAYAGVGRFDLIFCRNVLIYFDAQSKAQVIKRLLNHLQPDGHLFLGQSETLDTSTVQLQCLKPSIYTHRFKRLTNGDG